MSWLTFTGPEGQDVNVQGGLAVAVSDFYDKDGRPTGLVEIYLADQTCLIVRGSAKEVMVSLNGNRHLMDLSEN